ncbi:FixJ family two-component response regulator [Cupriavidus metallidurans]|jgi:FixJ family two-component response regulator|uniref:Response regulator transcription factor n=3 Tax=Cupriavidus TaxID=106589 RepID=A0A482ILQ4_9BURK|nr:MULTISPECIES: response regulator [Cupriavidus]KWR72308.1 LuxR family transcriptional regulator [Cupriavidus sp. SHE]MDE4917916.1 response regulator [Cupriavidus metallidurans]QBP09668.1 response regulator transcription factor [Cupriavidus metallidurans]QGS30483.1 response regulator [Cupriavidus metallidurans]QWC90019.1 response regulator transcription factor [Cupriavidus metallidurans]
MNAMQPTVCIVDDDDSVRRALARVLGAHRYHTSCFDSAKRFLDNVELENSPICAVVDLQMPDMDGIALQQTLSQRVPVVILTGHADVSKAVQAMQAGAIDFLEKPVQDGLLLAAVERACERAREQFARKAELRVLRQKIERLTPREREVLGWIVSGLRNKQVASELGTVEKTIKVHRAHVMQKLEVDSLPALVRIADKMGMGIVART